MRIGHGRFSLTSLKFQLIAGVVSVILPLCVFLIYYNFYSIRNLHSQVANDDKNILFSKMQEIDARLGDINMGISNYIYNNPGIQDMEYLRDPDDRYIAKAGVFQQISSDILQYKYVNSIFIHSRRTGDFIASYHNVFLSYEDQQAINAYLTDLIDHGPDLAETMSHGYFDICVNGKYYIVRIFKNGSLYMGVWLVADGLLKEAQVQSIGNKGVVLFVDDEGNAMNRQDIVEGPIRLNGGQSYYTAGRGGRYLVVTQRSTQGNYHLVAFVPDRQILKDLVYFQVVIVFIAALSILLIPVLILFLQHVVLGPLRHLLAAIETIQGGNVRTRVKSHRAADEFATLENNFNLMLDQIEKLKIDVYEEQIAKQKEELERLELQMNPHFLKNSLHDIYALAQMKDYEHVQAMSLNLFKYYNYVRRRNFAFVRLEKEIEHVENYINIQQMRFEKRFAFSMDIEKDLLQTKVPPLILQIFVENIFSHALTEEPIRIRIGIARLASPNGPKLRLVVSDTGRNFEEDVLRKLRAGEMITDDRGEHIGIWNIRRRLDLLYGGKASLAFDNLQPHGARVEITLPVEE